MSEGLRVTRAEYFRPYPHTVNKKGVPVQLKGSAYYNDYWASVTLIHFMREGDRRLPVADLIIKYSFKKCREIAEKGWK